MATAVFVLLLDGDKATWNSARKKFQGCKIVFCAFHAAENMKKRFGPLCKKNLSLSEDLAIASRWIQCQDSGCEKWCEIKENDNFPLNFTCDTSGIHGVTCETPQNSSCEWIKDEGKEIEKEEIVKSLFQLTNETEFIECYKLTGHRHSSQARFALVIKKELPNFHPISPSHTSSNSSSSSYSLNSIAASDLLPVKELSELLLKAEEASMSDHVPIMFYEVESRKKEGLVDIVAIYPNGSICSTGSNFANYGLPCELDMAFS